jgi:hypothetical protein
MAADTRGTHHASANLKPHDMTGKQVDLPHGFCCNIAGTVSVCASLYSELDNQMTKFPTPFFHDHVRDAIKETQFLEFANRSAYALRTELGITVKEWREGPIAQYLRDEGRKVLQDVAIDAQLIIAGFAGESAVLLEMFGKEPPEMRHYCAIGSGGNAAYAVLVNRQQEPYMSVQRSLIHAVEAMEAARLDAIKRDPLNPDVGSPVAYIILTRKAMRVIPANNVDLLNFAARFKGKDTGLADRDKVWREKLRRAMWIYQPTRP